MWNGKKTPELIAQAKEYYKQFKFSPDCYEEVDYECFDDDMDFFMKAMQNAMKANIHLDEFLAYYPDAEWPPKK